jgi:hypothetical protein
MHKPALQLAFGSAGQSSFADHICKEKQGVCRSACLMIPMIA